MQKPENIHTKFPLQTDSFALLSSRFQRSVGALKTAHYAIIKIHSTFPSDIISSLQWKMLNCVHYGASSKVSQCLSVAISPPHY